MNLAAHMFELFSAQWEPARSSKMGTMFFLRDGVKYYWVSQTKNIWVTSVGLLFNSENEARQALRTLERKMEDQIVKSMVSELKKELAAAEPAVSKPGLFD